jgi:hypothetical protein
MSLGVTWMGLSNSCVIPAAGPAGPLAAGAAAMGRAVMSVRMDFMAVLLE